MGGRKAPSHLSVGPVEPWDGTEVNSGPARPSGAMKIDCLLEKTWSGYAEPGSDGFVPACRDWVGVVQRVSTLSELLKKRKKKKQ
jgi:hypothetical protein